ncbi:MAG TPA: hypothetical protein PKW33_04155 [Anaerolineaceae bacterium]|nr:hypothetical protein [Anaerolineaceae bacterium]HPN50755.1 hypothetical protein [Anaerolineaceae bacterium]
MIILKCKPKNRTRAIYALFLSAQISFLLSVLLRYLPDLGLAGLLPTNAADFASGFFTGYCIVAWLAFLAFSGKFFKPLLQGKE